MGKGKLLHAMSRWLIFQPQILLKIKQNVYKTLVNSDFYTIIKILHFSFLAEKSGLDIATVSNLDSFHDGATGRQIPSWDDSFHVVYAPAERAGK